MSFNNRFICKIKEDYSLESIKDRINETNYFIENGEKYELKNKIELLNEYDSDEISFIYGRYGFEIEEEARIPSITEEKIIDVGDKIVTPTVLNFWISNNGILLFNSLGKPNQKIGKEKLSEILFNNPNEIEEKKFDIEKINSAINNGELNNMWISSFSGRKSNVKGGTLSGNNVNEDVMFTQTNGSSKTSTGITYEINNEDIKIKIYEKGTIQFLTKEFEVNDPCVFQFLNDFEKFIK